MEKVERGVLSKTAESRVRSDDSEPETEIGGIDALYINRTLGVMAKSDGRPRYQNAMLLGEQLRLASLADQANDGANQVTPNFLHCGFAILASADIWKDTPRRPCWQCSPYPASASTSSLDAPYRSSPRRRVWGITWVMMTPASSTANKETVDDPLRGACGVVTFLARRWLQLG